MENPIEMDENWGYPYDSGNHHIAIESLNIAIGNGKLIIDNNIISG